MCVFKDTPISCTAFPTTENITESQVKGASRQHVLGDPTLSIPVVRNVFIWNEGFNVHAINCTQTSFEEWKEIWVAMNLGWYVVYMREFNISAIKSLRYDHVKDLVENPISYSIFLPSKLIYTYIEIVPGARWKRSLISRCESPVRQIRRNIVTFSARPRYLEF